MLCSGSLSKGLQACFPFWTCGCGKQALDIAQTVQSLQYVLGPLPGKIFFEDGVLSHMLENHCTRGLQAYVPTPR